MSDKPSKTYKWGVIAPFGIGAQTWRADQWFKTRKAAYGYAHSNHRAYAVARLERLS